MRNEGFAGSLEFREQKSEGVTQAIQNDMVTQSEAPLSCRTKRSIRELLAILLITSLLILWRVES